MRIYAMNYSNAVSCLFIKCYNTKHECRAKIIRLSLINKKIFSSTVINIVPRDFSELA